jgi:hypothetical protein
VAGDAVAPAHPPGGGLKPRPTTKNSTDSRFFFMRGHSIEDLLKFLVELNKVAIDTFECLELVHAI